MRRILALIEQALGVFCGRKIALPPCSVLYARTPSDAATAVVRVAALRWIGRRQSTILPS